MAGPLLIIQNDAVYDQVKRVGRFSLPDDCAASRAHLQVAVSAMQEKMIAGLTLRGYEYQGQYGFEFGGPYEHIEVSDDCTPDPGPTAGPDPRDLEAQARWERAEKARVAKTMGESVHLVDYTLTAVFRRRRPVTFRRF